MLAVAGAQHAGDPDRGEGRVAGGADTGGPGPPVPAGAPGDQDVVAERAEEVARLALLYDILKAEALSPRASADLARKAIDRWT